MGKVKLAFDIADSLRSMAEKIENFAMAADTDGALKQSKPSEPEAEPRVDEEEVTLEMVRALLADKAQEGKREAVKALITKFGAEKLTDVPTEQYAELFKEAEGL